jgi:hypothetical protein
MSCANCPNPRLGIERRRGALLTEKKNLIEAARRLKMGPKGDQEGRARVPDVSDATRSSCRLSSEMSPRRGRQLAGGMMSYLATQGGRPPATSSFAFTGHFCRFLF